jgi:hypothetical protein
MKFRPHRLALSLNLCVQVHPMMSMVAYIESGAPTLYRYLRFQEKTEQGYALL